MKPFTYERYINQPAPIRPSKYDYSDHESYKQAMANHNHQMAIWRYAQRKPTN